MDRSEPGKGIGVVLGDVARGDVDNAVWGGPQTARLQSVLCILRSIMRVADPPNIVWLTSCDSHTPRPNLCGTSMYTSVDGVEDVPGSAMIFSDFLRV